jgi:hypothetical protein
MWIEAAGAFREKYMTVDRQSITVQGPYQNSSRCALKGTVSRDFSALVRFLSIKSPPLSLIRMATGVYDPRNFEQV